MVKIKFKLNIIFYLKKSIFFMINIIVFFYYYSQILENKEKYISITIKTSKKLLKKHYNHF